jgi:UDP-N-acetyl-D-glucosamine dehydrogenase
LLRRGNLRDLERKIRDKSALVGIVGLGYVGLPLATAFAKAGFRVLGVEIQKKRVDLVNQGKSYIGDVSSEALASVIADGLLEATTDQSRLKEADAVCICVPTPLTKSKEPDLSYVIYESEEVAKCLRRGQLIILESTTYPGTTRQVVLPILERSGLKVGADFYLAFSPERIDPGSIKHTVRDIPKVVGGIEPRSTKLASLFYRQMAETVFAVSSSEVAEMTKVFENVFRSINIAMVNELAQLCHDMGISVWEVIEAASSKPFGYMPFYPGPGVGGHCIPLDPYYLASKAREYDFHTRFIELAAEINEHMPYYVTSQIMEALSARGKSLNSAKILVLGVAYKKDVADIRESPSLKLIELLGKEGAKVDYNDPYVPQIQIPQNNFLNSIDITEESLSSMDCIVIATDHSCYDLDEIVRYSKLTFDTRGATKRIDRPNIIRLGE